MKLATHDDTQATTMDRGCFAGMLPRKDLLMALHRPAGADFSLTA